MNGVDELLLEHGGVKGMKWGVRKVKSGAQKTGSVIKSHPKTTAAIIAGGTAIAAAILMSHGKVKVSQLKSHEQQLAELDQITNYMGARTLGSLASRGMAR